MWEKGDNVGREVEELHCPSHSGCVARSKLNHHLKADRCRNNDRACRRNTMSEAVLPS
jgi:hypothetical protein